MILAHRAPRLFKRLSDRLAKDFTVIAHLDASADRQEFAGSADVFLLPQSHRIRWGSYAMIAAALDMLKHGLTIEKAETFTLISGDTYPVCSPRKLAEILDQRVDCIDSDLVAPSSETAQRIKNTYLPDTQIGELRPGMHFLHRYLDSDITGLVADAERSRLARPQFLADYRYAKGAQWWSLTRGTVEKIMALVDEDPRLVEALRFSAIPDEAFFQTAIAKLGLHEAIRPSLVFAKWDTVPAPHTFERVEDIEFLKGQKRPFARKFSEASDGLIQRIEEELW
nr:beta-1,6-N-acetylglucosaminyltransferase [Phreatobacter stygius]